MNEAIRFFDAHCHLQDSRLQHCMEEVIQEAKSQGVERFACNGCCEADWPEVQQISERHPEVVPNFGLHPWWVGQRSERWLDRLRRQLEACPTAGLGECGLDNGRRGAKVDLEEQAEVLRQQFRLAKQLQRPLSVHCVNAFGKLQEAVQREGPFPSGLILHSWMGHAELVKGLAKCQGVYFSISGHTCSMSPAKLAPMLQQIPLDRLLLETDAPDGVPKADDLVQVPQSPAVDAKDASSPQQLNHPANIRAVLKIVADTTGMDSRAIASAAFRNACQLFALP